MDNPIGKLEDLSRYLGKGNTHVLKIFKDVHSSHIGYYRI